jgi:hypothetical protein
MPKSVEFIKRYALAEIAALIGIPLALVGLLLTAVAARDTARQLEVVQVQSQPTFRLTLRKVKPEDLFRGYSELIVTSTGHAADISVQVRSAFIHQGPGPEYPVRLASVRIWEEAPPEVGQDVRLKAELSLPEELRRPDSSNSMDMVSTMVLGYRDLFGNWHSKVYQFGEELNSSMLRAPAEVDFQQHERCVALIEDSLEKALARFGRVYFRSGSAFDNFRRFAQVVPHRQVVDCFGPPR